MNAANLFIEIKARPTPPTESENAAKHSRLEWRVDVYISGKRAVRDIKLKDPLSKEQRSLCRWYLEEYAQKNPYSVDLGKDVRALLEEYPKKLWRELCLANVLRSCENPHQQRLRLLTIRASEGEYLAENSKNTIHQLFWETLEYLDQITTSGWKVIVERHLPPTGSSGFPLTKPLRSWDRKQRNRMFNILLVIGRDTSRNPERYSDVCPFLALGTLKAVQQKLNVNGGRLNFHVEVARPGTFPSFKEHLRRAKEIHGPRYFQIVHFDLHGMVKPFK